MRILVSFLTWILVGILTFAFFWIGLLVLLPLSFFFEKDNRGLLHVFSRLWGQGVARLTPFWKIQVKGTERIEKGRPYVIVSNHQSLLDILLLLANLPVHFKFIAKRELFWIPFFGWYLALAGYIPLKRGDPESGRACLAQANGWLRRGVSVLFFPEGTRSPDGEIHEFKAGAFRLAIEAEADILPLVIRGTHEVVPKHSWLIAKQAPLCLSILDPVSVRGPEMNDLDRLRDQVQSLIVKEFKSPD